MRLKDKNVNDLLNLRLCSPEIHEIGLSQIEEQDLISQRPTHLLDWQQIEERSMKFKDAFLETWRLPRRTSLNWQILLCVEGVL